MESTLEGFVEHIELSRFKGTTDVDDPYLFTATLVDNIGERYTITSYTMPGRTAKEESGKIAQRKVRVNVRVQDSLYFQQTPYQILKQ
nr:hypothetical protein [Nanoarchaeum sp.]